MSVIRIIITSKLWSLSIESNGMLKIHIIKGIKYINAQDDTNNSPDDNRWGYSVSEPMRTGDP